MDKIDLEWFDVERYLSTHNIPFDPRGKNVKSGWIGINCLWCDDPSNHLGINLETKGINCWRCPAKGTVIKLIMKIERIGPDEAITELKKFMHKEYSISKNTEPPEALPKDKQQTRLPSHSQKSPAPYHLDYFIRNRFDPDFLTKQYDLRFTGPIGDYRMRTVVPIYMGRRLVSFTTRDVTGLSPIPWLHGRPDQVQLSPKQCLYNLHTVKDTALIVEGASDVWRMGEGAVATFGDKWTTEQVFLLRGVKRAFVLFDTEEEAQRNAHTFASNLSAIVPDVHIYELDEGDPGDLKEDDIKAIRLEIFGRKYW